MNSDNQAQAGLPAAARALRKQGIDAAVALQQLAQSHGPLEDCYRALVRNRIIGQNGAWLYARRKASAGSAGLGAAGSAATSAKSAADSGPQPQKHKPGRRKGTKNAPRQSAEAVSRLATTPHSTPAAREPATAIERGQAATALQPPLAGLLPDQPTIAPARSGVTRRRWTLDENQRLLQLAIQSVQESLDPQAFTKAAAQQLDRSVDAILSRCSTKDPAKRRWLEYRVLDATLNGSSLELLGWDRTFLRWVERRNANPGHPQPGAAGAEAEAEASTACGLLPSIDAFLDFTEFDWQPTTVAGGILTEEFVEPLLKKGPDAGALMISTFSTGTGKTFTSLLLIIAELLRGIKLQLEARKAGGDLAAVLDELRTIYFVVHSTPSVIDSHRALCNLIRHGRAGVALPSFTAAQKEYLLSLVCHLPAQHDSVANLTPEQLDALVARFELGKDRDLERLLFGWKQETLLREHLPSNKLASTAARHFDERREALGRDLYAALLGAVRAKLRNRGKLPLADEDLLLVMPLVPALPLESGRARVAFLSCKKFLYGFDYLRTKHYPYVNPERAWLIVDEFDRQNEEILGYLLPANAIALIHALRHYAYPNLSTCLAAVEPQNERAIPYIDKLAAQIAEFADTWALANMFKPDPASFKWEETHGSLFSSPGRPSVTSYTNRREFHLDIRPDLNTNFLTMRDKSGPDSNSFLDFLDDLIDLVNRHIPRAFLNAASKRCDYQRKQTGPDATPPNLSMELNKLLSSYGLMEPDGRQSPLAEHISAYRRIAHLAAGTRSEGNQFDYHTSGFSLVTFRPVGESDDQLDIQQRELMITPTGFIRALVERGAVILGLSATGDAATVVGNFDVDYLAEKLGPRWHTLSNHAIQKMREEQDLVHGRRGRARLEVELVAGDKAFLDELVAACRPGQSVAEVLLSCGLTHDRYWVDTITKPLAAVRAFLANPLQRYFIAFLNRTVSVRLAAFLREAIAYLAQQQGAAAPYFEPTLIAADLRDGKLKKIHTVLATSHQKVVVFTSYKSLGEGKNPDYPYHPAHEEGRVICLSDTPGRARTVDADAGYFEMPTNIIACSEDRADWEKDRFRLCHFIMSLQTYGTLSQAEASIWIKRFIGAESLTKAVREFKTKRYHHSNDFYAAVARLIRQALGRFARSSVKCLHTSFWLDCQLAAPLTLVVEDTRLASEEYLAAKRCCAGGAQAGTPSSAERRLLTFCNRAHHRHHAGIHRLQPILRAIRTGTTSASDQAFWGALRHQALTNPGLDTIPEAYLDFYADLPAPASSYTYNQNGDSERDVVNITARGGKKEVSAEASRLPQLLANPVVARHWREQGFATAFPVSDALLTPYAFQAVYLGGLGEEACTAVLSEFGFQVNQLPADQFEKYDRLLRFATGFACPVDFKHFELDSHSTEHSQELIRKAIGKFRALGYPGLVLINTLGDTKTPVNFYSSDRLAAQLATDGKLDYRVATAAIDQADIVVIPALIDARTGAANSTAITELLRWAVYRQLAIPSAHTAPQPLAAGASEGLTAAGALDKTLLDQAACTGRDGTTTGPAPNAG